jgi:hypothetical protein
MGIRDVVTSKGKDDMHLGWLVPGKTICLGAGPVSLRYSLKEAAELCEKLEDLLAEAQGVAHAYTPCGCTPPRPEPSPIQAVQDFWEDDDWGHGVGLPRPGHRVAGLG